VIRAVGVEGLADAVRRSEALVYALGGITPERVSACLEAGAHGVAVLGGINLAEDPFEATLAYLEALDA
jgi:thiamine-phosphate pyrophosphorylase